VKVLKLNITQALIATVFCLALLLPSAVDFAHIFESHEHKTCTDLSTHLHEKQLDCSICDFHFSVFNFEPIAVTEFAVLNGFKKVETTYYFPKLSSPATHFYLRGPPLLS
tara:strand:+ start:135065 stop:135394 length:330 start_codon:yes stop_codon:yes gene_type:complete